MNTRWLNKKLYSALLISAVMLASSIGSAGAFAQEPSPQIRRAQLMNVHPTGRTVSRNASGQVIQRTSQIPATLLQGGTPLPTTLVHITDTSNSPGGWSPSSPDPAGIDYWPLTGRLLVSDSEVDENTYWAGKNVYDMTKSGTLTSTCTTFTPGAPSSTYNNFSGEPSGLAINPNNNHIFFSDDNGVSADRVFEVAPGTDGQYCSSDDTVTSTPVGTLYGATDAEDVAYGNNTVFIADGVNAEVYVIPLGSNGILGGGDDGAVTHFDTAIFGLHNVEGIGYNADSGTLFMVSALASDKFLGEVTTSGTLLNTYDLLDYTALEHPEDVTYAPGSQNPLIKNVYITDRGLDNNQSPGENDGQVWEINIGIPWVLSVMRANPTPTGAVSVSYNVTFSEAVTGVEASDFNLIPGGGVSGASITNVSGSGTSYTVTVNTGSGDGTLRLNVIDDDSITDSAGLKLGGPNPGNGTFTTGEIYTVDRTAAPPGAATLVSPSGVTADTTPVYTWNAVSDATHYYLWVNGPSGSLIKTWYTAAQANCDVTCSIEPSTTLGGGAHTWWIRTWSPAGTGPWSASRSFTVNPPGAATLVSPSGAITDTTPTYTWNAVSGATYYYLWVNGPSGNRIKTWYAAAQAGCSAGGTCSVTPATVLGSGAHTWWIRTWSPAGTGPWSSPTNFSLP